MSDRRRDASELDESDTFQALLEKAAHVSEVAPRPVLSVGDTLLDGRFTVRRALGEGGMGAVYEVWDRERHGLVALKTLTRADPASIYYLKNEFRALAEVTHANLVTLHEFFGEPERWFFTMERVRGQSFREYVQPARSYGSTRGPGGCFDEDRLRDALAQLVTGAAALHAAGKLHCDLKPSNVLVEDGGRVVLLDFGLVADVSEDDRIGHTLGNVVAGTPVYMAPEQANAGACPASDLYAIGVMLYEALCGRLPFDGNATAVLVRKQMETPEPPSRLAPGVPPDLERLAMALLSVAPEQRPTAAQVLATLAPKGMRRTSLPAPSNDELLRFVGRQQELAQLADALAQLPTTGPQLLLLAGPSGIGKTRLLARFGELARKERGAVVLGGRCHERESVPYNAFDSLIDALSRQLRRLPELEAARLMPRDVHTLVRLFPVLSRVQAVAQSPGRSPAGLDPMELRRRAFSALKELLARISDTGPLLLCFDDLQWADDDSLRLLRELLSEPDPPAALWVGGVRSDAQAGELHDKLSELRPWSLLLAPLGDDEARDLVDEIPELAGELRARVVAEARGNPFLLGELVQHARARQQDAGGGLDAALAARLSPLPPEARQMLDVLSVAARPLPLPTLLDASGVGGGVSRLLTLLRNGHFLRSHRGERAKERLELYHDRIRSALVARLGDAQRRALHGQLAEALERHAPHEHEHAAEHWLLSGQTRRAAGQFARAAELADESYAFAVAARLYTAALEHGDPDDRAGRRVLQARQGDALSRTGRAGDAARAFLAAAELCDDSDARIALSRTAAQHLLACGKLDEGTAVLRRALDAAGVQYPESAELAERWLSLRREQLEASGMRYEVRAATAINPELLAQIDLCCGVSPALGSYDFVRSGYFAAHGLLLALEAGEPARVARALSTYATSLASSGQLPRARALANQSLSLARERGDEELVAAAELSCAQVALFEGDFEAAVAGCDAARERFRRANVGASLEVPICHVFSNMALHMLGRMEEHVRRSHAQLAEARDLGHIHAEASLRAFGIALGALVDDAPEQAREQARLALDLWPQEQFHAERFKVLRLQAWCDLYEGRASDAATRIEQARQTALESGLLESRYWRFWWLDLIAQVGLMAAARGDRRWLALADDAVEQLERDGLSYARPLVATYRAGLAQQAGDRAHALELLGEAAATADPLLAACAAHVLAAERGDGPGLASAEARLSTIVRRPAAWARWRVPGFAIVG